MKKILLALLIAGGFASFHNDARAQLALTNFNSGLPTGWSMIKVDANTPNSSYWNPIIVTDLTSNAWMTWPIDQSGDSCMATTSYFNNTTSGTADRWLITKPFTVTSPDMVINWQDVEIDKGGGTPDVIDVYVSTTAGNTVASFSTTAIYSGQVSQSGQFAPHAAQLGAYNGQTITIAFRDHTTDGGFCGIDFVQTEVLATNDIALNSITPGWGSPANYLTAAGNVALSGTVENMGYNNITSYTISYQVGSNAPVTSAPQSVNIGPLSTATFTGINMPTPASGTAPVMVWATLTSATDVNLSNDSLQSEIGVPATFPPKRLLFEEPTGTWCGFCVRGIIYMDSMWKEHPTTTSLVSVHDYNTYDAMAIENTLTEDYDTWISAQTGGSYPGIYVDRTYVDDPSNIFYYYTNYSGEFAFANLSLSATIGSGSIQSSVTVTPAINLSGDYRVELLVSEDQVHGTTGGYAQHDYYSTSSANPDVAYLSQLGTMIGMGFNFTDSTYPVPAASMYYDFVARYTVPDMGSSPNGVAASLPASLVAGTPYTYNFSNVNIASDWISAHLHVVVLLIDDNSSHLGSYGTVLNSISTDTTFVNPNPISDPTSVVNLPPYINRANLYPNPAKDVAYLNFDLSQTTNIAVNVYDALGRLVYSVPSQEMNSGINNITISTANFAAGMYNVTIQTESGITTTHLSVIR